MKITIYKIEKKNNRFDYKCRIPGFEKDITFFEFALATGMLKHEQFKEKIGNEKPILIIDFTLDENCKDDIEFMKVYNEVLLYLDDIYKN